MRRRLFLPLAVGCLLAAAGGAGAAPAKPRLAVLGDDALAVSAKTGKEQATTFLTVFNAGHGEARLKITFDPATASGVHVATVAPRAIAAGDHRRVKVVLDGLEALRKTMQGQLVVEGGVEPVTRAVTVTPAPQPWTRWSLWVVLGALAAIPLLMLAVYAWATRNGKRPLLGKAAPGPKWSFESWATTVTAVGAILGTVLGGSIVPAVPRQIGKDTLVALNLLFGGMAVTAPFIFQAIRRGTPSPDPARGLWGYNWALSLACSVTCGAVVGEVGALALVAWEVTGGGGWGWVMVAVLILLGLLAVRYFFVTARELATTDWEKLAEEDKAKAAQAQSSILLGTASDAEKQAALDAAEVVVPRRTWSLP